jgi:integrase
VEGSCPSFCSIVPVGVDRRRRCQDSTPATRQGNKGLRYPADRPKVEEIVAVIRAAGDGTHSRRLRGRAGLRIQEALALTEGDLDERRGSTPGPPRQGRASSRGRHGRMGIGTASAWLELRRKLAVGPLRCVISGATGGRRRSPAAARAELRRTAAAAGVRRRFAPHQLRHAHAVEMAREGVPLIVIQRQLGHSNLGITSVHLQGIDSSEIIETVHARRAPMIPVSASLRL